MKYKAVIFDCDGTLLNTLDDLTDAVNVAMKSFDCPLHTVPEVREMVGNGIKVLIERALPTDKRMLTERALSIFKDYYAEHYADKTAPYDGIADLTRTLCDLGIKTAVVSNKNSVYLQLLCDKFFKNTLSVVVGENPSLNKKPAPDMVEYALAKLGVDKKDAVYIGDSEVDVATATNSGLDGIFVGWGFRSKEFLKENGASIIIDTPSELVTLIG